MSTLASLYLPTVNAAIIDDGVAKGDLSVAPTARPVRARSTSHVCDNSSHRIC
ncbi:MAG: hypothetical protein K2X52_26745 [Mycobacteriaceae bacterium]|nr:hypothetical protein [Mycobacteriaceae bacterium]